MLKSRRTFTKMLGGTAAVAAALREIGERTLHLKVLGSYPAA